MQYNGPFLETSSCVTAVACKDPGHSTKSAGGRLQLNMHTPYLCGFEWSDTVIWCMVEWCTQNLHQNGSLSFGTSHATTTERYQYTASMDINNTRYQRIQSLLQNHMRHATESHATMNNNNNLMNWWMWGEKISLIWKGRKRFWAVLCQGFCFIVLSYIVEHCNPICIAFTLV